MPIDVVVAHAPLIYVRVHGEVRESDVAVAAAVFDRVFANAQTFTSFADIRDLRGIPGAAERKAIADWMRRIEPQMRRHCVGAGNLIRSSVVRGAMTAIYWLFEPPVPQHYPATLDEGLDWCVQRLADAGIDARTHATQLLGELASSSGPEQPAA